MARTTRAKAAATTPTKATPKATVPAQETSSKKSTSQRHTALRRKLYKKARRARQAEALRAAVLAVDDPAEKKQLSSLRGQLYRQWKPRGEAGSEKLAQLERVVRAQREEIAALRKTLGGSVVPSLEPPAPATPGAKGAGEVVVEEPDSSPVKIAQQLVDDASRSPEVAEVKAEEVEKMAVVVEDATVANATETDDVNYPTLPSVESEPVVEEVQQTIEEDSTPTADGAVTEQQTTIATTVLPSATPSLRGTPSRGTPVVSKAVRDSSAEESHAETPRNVRRSPRKRTVKRRSFAGHSYAC